MGRHARRISRAAAAFAALGLVTCCAGLTGLTVASQLGHGPARPGVTPLVAVQDGSAARPGSPGARRPAARPTGLVIPSIGVRTRLVRLGRTRSGALQVPAATAVAGWYTGSPRPGDIGPAVIAGHVDSYRGPGVFFRLRLLRPDAAVYVRRADGTTAVFTVIAVRLFPRTSFPAAAVYGPAPQAELHLITCGGTFDRALGSYLSNVVVYAVAAGRVLSRPSGAATSAAAWRDHPR